jgi:hypothetical protein
MEPDRETVLALLGGTPEQISSELAEFAAGARVLSQDRPRFIDEYPEKWVAVYRGQVAASGESLEEAARDASAKGLPREHLIMRHITRAEKTYFF